MMWTVYCVAAIADVSHENVTSWCIWPDHALRMICGSVLIVFLGFCCSCVLLDSVVPLVLLGMNGVFSASKPLLISQVVVHCFES